MATNTATSSVQIRHIISASREVLFAAWTTPETLQQWWGSEPDGWCTVCEIDPRVGGRYRLGMYVPSEQTEYIVGGEYREITPPSKLVFTWNSERGDQHVTDTLVVVEFQALERNHTEVIVTHSLLPAAEPDRFRDGWQGGLARLTEQVHNAEDSRVPCREPAPNRKGVHV